MRWVTDADGARREVVAGISVAAARQDFGSLLAVDTLRRLCEVLRVPVRVLNQPGGWEHLGIRASLEHGEAAVLLARPGELSPQDPAARFATLAGTPVAAAREELARWRALMADWAESPSKPMCAQVQQDLLSALEQDLDTARAVQALRGSLALELPPGCLFETWAWADRLLGVELAADVGR